MKNRSVLPIIFLTIFIDLLGFGMILPLLPIWAEEFTTNSYLIISLGSAFSLAQFIFAPLWGRLSDRIGRRPIILASLLGGGFAYLSMAFASTLWMLYVARLLQGMFTAGGLGAAPAMVADVTSPEERSRGMGLIGAAFGLGFVFGPAMGGLLNNVHSSLPFVVAAVLCWVNFVWAAIKLPETYRPGGATSEARVFDIPRLRQAFRHPQLAFLLAMLFVNTFAFSNLEQTFTLFVQGHFRLDGRSAASLTAYILTYVGVVAVVVQGGLIRPLTSRFGDAPVLVAGLLLTGMGMILTPLPTTLAGLLMASTLVSLGWGLVNPTTSSLISRASASDSQGGMLGLSQGLASLGRIIGPQWGGWTFKTLGIAWPYWTGGAVLLVSFVFAAAKLLPAPGRTEALPEESDP